LLLPAGLRKVSKQQDEAGVYYRRGPPQLPCLPTRQDWVRPKDSVCVRLDTGGVFPFLHAIPLHFSASWARENAQR
jgi:hypothetical protein